MQRKKIVIIGGGFAGLSAAKKLNRHSEFDVTIIDKQNHHLFQPLLYQVATSALSPADIAMPIRAIFREKKHIEILMEEVLSIDKEKQIVKTNESEIGYDYLIAAPGARHSYFNHPEWESHAPGLKTLKEAIFLREKILLSLEEAEKCNNQRDQEKFLTFAIVGAGPTGVELAGAIKEILKRTIAVDFNNIDPDKTKVVLIEALPKVLSFFPDELSQRAEKDLKKIGVEILLNTMVTNVNENGLEIGDNFIETKNVIWAAGNNASPILKSLNTLLDKAGRVIVNDDLTIEGKNNLFVIGDSAAFKDRNGEYLPAVAQVAMQQGRYAADIIIKNIPSEKRKKFSYNDMGIMATIGRAKAVADIKGFKFSGFFAWIVWGIVHVMSLIGFRNKFRVMAEWAWYYITFRHGIRLIIGRVWK